MKNIIGLSLALNITLVVVLYFSTKKTVIVKTPQSAKTAMIGRQVVQSVSLKSAAIRERGEFKHQKTDEANLLDYSVDEYEYHRQFDTVKNERDQFLSQDLGLEMEKIQKLEKMRASIQEKIISLYQKYPAQISFSDRRKVIDLEEELHNNMVKAMGQANWEKFNKFKENYNHEVLRKAEADHGPVILMDL